MMNLTRSRPTIAALMVGLAALAGPGAAMGQELPPAILVDRYLFRADRYVQDGDWPGALAALDTALALQAEHDLELPEPFWFRHAEAALGAGTPDVALASAARYLELVGQEGEHYWAAMELLEEANTRQTLQRILSDWTPGEVFRDCDECPQMVVVPAGTFTMGSPPSEEGRDDNEGPQHSVTIPVPFAVGVYEVTFAEWNACVAAGGCPGGIHNEGRGLPANGMPWNPAQEYVSWLSHRTGARYRLLSEAEWEYVARAGSRTARYWGEGWADQCRYANGDDFRFEYRLSSEDEESLCFSSGGDGYPGFAPVGSFEPNAFGLYDVLGNVEEWTQDCWNDSYAGAPANGSAWQSGDCSRRVLRGGWVFDNEELRSAYRGNASTDGSGGSGLRVARTLN